MDLLVAAFCALPGAAALGCAGAVLRERARMRGRWRRTTGVIVGHRKIASPGESPTYAPVFRFTAEDGRTVQAAGSVSTAWRRGAGRRIPVVYDPADPEGTADRPGGLRAQLALAPVLLAVGAGLLITAAAVLLR
ncbi:DUF3592 domain-containing protein [Spirillospora sp. NPDC052242]